MKFDLYHVRKQYRMSQKDFAKCAGLAISSYVKHERKGEIPSKYIYVLYLNLPNFPVPHDFFYFTSYNLKINMSIYRISQSKIASLFGLSSQATVSKYIERNIPMYEFRDVFKECFNPLIVSFALEANNNDMALLTDLSPHGMLTQSYRDMAKERAQKRLKNRSDI